MKNVILEYLEFQKAKITSLAQIILKNFYDEAIFEKFLTTFIDIRYYNYYDTEGEPLETYICKRLRKDAMFLMEGNTDEDYLTKVKENLFVFNYILYFTNVKNCADDSFIDSISDYQKKLLLIETPNVKEELDNFIKDYAVKKKNYFDGLNTNDFKLYIKDTSNFKISNIFIDHNISFPKLYSDYAIERVFNDGKVNEEKLIVEYIMLSKYIIEDIEEMNYESKYLVEFTSSLFENREKLNKILNIGATDIFKDKVIFKVYYKEIKDYMDILKDLIKDGFLFAVKIEDEEIPQEDLSFLDIYKYIILNPDSKYCHNDRIDDKIIILG